MDRHAEWIKAQQDLSEASKAVHFWDTMPSDVRVKIGISRHRAKRIEARRRLRQVDKRCRDVSAANRAVTRSESAA